MPAKPAANPLDLSQLLHETSIVRESFPDDNSRTAFIKCLSRFATRLYDVAKGLVPDDEILPGANELNRASATIVAPLPKKSSVLIQALDKSGLALVGAGAVGLTKSGFGSIGSQYLAFELATPKAGDYFVYIGSFLLGAIALYIGSKLEPLRGS